jgi:DNA-binding NarL/FixJ family response regulator/predicted DNA-binding transcriptional regulator
MAGSSPGFDPALRDDLASRFKGLGITPDSVRVYLYLLAGDDWSLEQIAAELGADEGAARCALDELVQHGLIVRAEGDDVLHAVQPKVALARLLDQQSIRLREAERGLAEARRAAETLTEMTDELANLDPSSLEVIAGRFAVTDRVSELMRSAHDEVLTMLTRRPGPGAIEHARSNDAELLGRGVPCRVLVLEGQLRGSPQLMQHLRTLHEMGAQVRVAAYLPTRLIVVDRSAAVVPSNLDAPSEGAVLVTHEVLVSLLVHVFETIWESSRLLVTTTADDGEEWTPSALEREVMRLLAEGFKDESVARKVGMSLRSVRRLIAHLSQELGADSRFALGVRCAERGWACDSSVPAGGRITAERLED